MEIECTNHNLELTHEQLNEAAERIEFLLHVDSGCCRSAGSAGTEAMISRVRLALWKELYLVLHAMPLLGQD